ncbi:MAG: BTAD domain-containing putative transcriptional regulator [Rhodococcus sp. (in: high G+C Gram-positive bacteria)]
MLLKTKLTPPPLPDPMLERPRLAQLVSALVERHHVIMISATAGSGKTTAILGAATLIDRPIAWLTLDHTDAAPGRLLAYLEAVLRQALPGDNQLDGIVVRALRGGLQHPEAAGILAEAVGDAPVLLVLDDLERIGNAKEAVETLEGFLRYAGPETRVVLLSRHDIPLETLLVAPGRDTVVLPEEALAFTREETADLLEMLGESQEDVDQIIDATGGWVIGVLFETWRDIGSGVHSGNRRELLDRYFSSQVVESLSPEDREFLVVTSIFDQVTPERAMAVGQVDTEARMASLRHARLPLVWDDAQDAMRCHPRFREYLRRGLQRREQAEVDRIRRAAGLLYAREGYWEQAAQELLAAGQLEEALEPARQAIFALIDRLDLGLARRWLEQLAVVAQSDSSELTTAKLLLTLVDDDYRAGVQIVDAVAQRGELRELALHSDRAAALMASAYCGGLRLQDAREVLDVADGPEIFIARYLYCLYDETVPRVPRPEASGGLMDGVLAYADYFHGRLEQLTETSLEGVGSAVSPPWQIMALCTLGRLDEARRLYEDAVSNRVTGQLSLAVVAPELYIEAEDREAAHAAITRAWRLVRSRGPTDGELLLRLAATKVAVRLDRDPERALIELERLARNPLASTAPFVAAPMRMWRGLAFLLQHRDAEAVAELRDAVAIMVERGLRLDLPTAAIYLAEAQWRAGNEDAADDAADMALDAARYLGSNHRLLQALSEFPNVAARRLDSEVELDSPWRDLGRAITGAGPAAPVIGGVRIELREFGEAVLTVDGAEVRMRIAKAYEILAYLLLNRAEPVHRTVLLGIFFDGKNDTSTRAYLRQALYWIRRAIGDEDLILDGQEVQLRRELSAVSDSMRFETLLSRASRLVAGDRAAAIENALTTVSGGTYLPGFKSEWVESRRQSLLALAIDARCDLAELRFAAGRYADARASVEQALRDDPYREVSWRLLMRVVSMFGDADAALRVYRDCEDTLAEIGVAPSPSTRRLLDGLRR